ncbi:hypothetical protein [Streptosporangium carneum]|uniref:Uncharacterized protein n=1 Tax=Streptosporangium carneum TaxID=47481 RepID=A0A9W6HWI3_9ACTN|nr:hypothetical protein [Streptosporangium carneum]GLK07323.1 hypothetical protein GCM10017600_07280 [Streptosporangium carneum]
MTTRRTKALGEHPFELFFGGLAVFAGAFAVLGVVGSASVNALLPLPVVRAWGALQLLAGVLMVAGILLPYVRPRALVLGWRIERAGLWPLAATAVIYAVVVLAYSGTRALYPAGVYLALAATCLARAATVTRLERELRQVGGRDGG